MKTLKLADYIFEVNDKTTSNDQYPVLTSSQNGIVMQSEYFNKKVASRDTTGYKIVRFGQFTYRAMSDTGRFYINRQECCDAGIVSPAYPVFGVKNSAELAPEFLQMFFQTDYFQSLIVNQSRGSTRVSLKLAQIKALDIHVPSYDEQLAVIARLRKLEAIIDACKKQQRYLDELVKSRFVEMFGDPEFNTNGLPVVCLGDLCEVGSSKRIYQSEQSMTGIPFLRISDLVTLIDTGELKADLYIPESRYKELKLQGLVPISGDILVTSRGTLGRCYIVQDTDVFYFQDGMISWLSKFSGEVMPLYIEYLFAMYGFRKQIDGLQAGSTIAYLSIAMLKKLKIMVPPLALQQQFATFVQATDKSKLAVQQSLATLETLKKSLMQNWFG